METTEGLVDTNHYKIIIVCARWMKIAFDLVKLYWFISVLTLLRYRKNCGFYEGICSFIESLNIQDLILTY